MTTVVMYIYLASIHEKYLGTPTPLPEGTTLTSRNASFCLYQGIIVEFSRNFVLTPSSSKITPNLNPLFEFPKGINGAPRLVQKSNMVEATMGGRTPSFAPVSMFTYPVLLFSYSL
ncbi:hypothetical protein ASPSYDRAFT_52402, partial [Aspergillus sydowii CBS 593.65]